MAADAPGPDEFDALEGMARALTASGWYRVTRQFRPRNRYAAEDGSPKKTALFVDVETTGLHFADDRIIEFAAVPFEYSLTTGEVHTVGKGASYFEDPGIPIPEKVTAMTGISDDMVRGQRINDGHIAELVGAASLVIAHNASFDRRFAESRLPTLEAKPWACSHREVPWEEHGCHGTKLDYLLFHHCAEFFAAHRALNDCQVGIHVLATRLATGALPMTLLLRSARTKTVRIWAHGAPIEQKDKLKARRYQWHPGDARRGKAWYRDVPEPDADAECAWLVAEAYSGRRPSFERENHTAHTRYSARM